MTQGLALMDAAISPEWEYRYFSFNCNWDGHGTEMMASMSDGQGAEYFLHFTCEGVAGKVLNGTTLVNASEHLNEVPENFRAFKNEPAFSNDRASLFFWRHANQSAWHASPNTLKNYPLLGFLTGGAATYRDFAKEYYEIDIDINIVERIFETLTLTAEQLTTLNPEISIDDLREDLREIVGSAN